MNLVSLYSGADNLGDGAITAGVKIVLCIEKDSDCCKTIKLNHPDIEIINGLVSDYMESLPRADGIIGGPPCPEFSRAKSNRTMNLCEVDNFIRAREVTKAKFHFMENVQDLFKVHKERNFLVNCADYGVPQTRIRRVFTNMILPGPTHSKNPSHTLFGEPLKKWVSVSQALNINEDWFVSPTGFNEKNKKQIGRSIEEPIMTVVNGNDYQFTDKPKMSTKYHQFKNDYKEIRRLTNEELAILQGFRHDFKFYGSKSSVKKQIGNALPAAVSFRFFNKLLNEKKEEIIVAV